TGAFSAIEDSIASMVMKGQFDLNSLGSQLEQILIKLAVQQATGSLIGAIGGGLTGFDYMTPSGPGPALPGFATGGDMLVGGAGAPDSKLAMFRVSPGESIHVRTPEQRAAAEASSSGSGGVTNHNYFTFDPKALNKSIDSGVQKYIKENRTAIKAILGV
ncbi:MAG TPA: phage tail tape measure C-terminal domain-containing protein, partial [Kofleriaceae bacterium]|nr:phage tail tape measure C-terminal domain-containing protein [Kofleriaceae bacterium]